MEGRMPQELALAEVEKGCGGHGITLHAEIGDQVPFSCWVEFGDSWITPARPRQAPAGPGKASPQVQASLQPKKVKGKLRCVRVKKHHHHHHRSHRHREG
jgi:hypothetical protein